MVASTTGILITSLLVAASLGAKPKDLGAPGFSCDPAVMGRSHSVPKSVHALRYADIDIISALGDSLTNANGAGADPGDLSAMHTKFRGLAFSIGGQKTLEEHITLANVLKKFNPKLAGYSKGSGDKWENAQLNMAVGGSVAENLLDQAKNLVKTMFAHPEMVDFKNHWKLVHVFIGGNDVCESCKKHNPNAVNDYRDSIRAAVKYLHDNLPRTVVVLTGVMNLAILRKIDKSSPSCWAFHQHDCSCDHDASLSDDAFYQLSQQFQNAEQELQTSGEFDTKDDFTLVIQNFFERITVPALQPDGKPDILFFAPDCFHFAQFGHALVGKNLWANMLQPVGSKTTGNLTDHGEQLPCPSADCPFLRTTKNSISCKK